jgi:hypothetical protein
VITVGTNGDDEIVIRNRDNDTALVLPGDDVETLSMFVEMLVDELNDRDPDTAYVLEEYEAAGLKS